MHAPQIDAAMVLCAGAGGKRSGSGRLFCLYYRCCRRVKCEPQITLIPVQARDKLLGWCVLSEPQITLIFGKGYDVKVLLIVSLG